MKVNTLTKNKIFILGAGASNEYGLPLWKELNDSILEELENDIDNKYKYKKEIKEWLENIGENKKYSTIDECISKESILYHNDGYLIEDEIFSIIKSVLNKSFMKDKNDGWVSDLNNKIINNKIEDMIYFINYNYDNVLYQNFLNYKHLSGKEREVLFADRLNELKETYLECFCPHGFLTENQNNFNIQVDTQKIDKPFLNAVTCHDSKTHEIYSSHYTSKLSLFIIGLGGGIFINLEKLIIDNRNKVDKIYITIKDNYKKDEIIKFLIDKYKISLENIFIFDNCKELIEKVF